MWFSNRPLQKSFSVNSCGLLSLSLSVVRKNLLSSAKYIITVLYLMYHSISFFCYTWPWYTVHGYTSATRNTLLGHTVKYSFLKTSLRKPNKCLKQSLFVLLILHLVIYHIPFYIKIVFQHRLRVSFIVVYNTYKVLYIQTLQHKYVYK